MSERYTRTPNTVCLACSKPIYRRPGVIKKGRVFCSQQCYGIKNRKETPCIVCHKPILASANKKTCSRSCANTHRAGIKYKIGRPKDKIKDERALKLRLVSLRGRVCERCGYNKVEILNVHHRDKNHSNNEFSNLELLCPNCHDEEHYLEKSWIRDKLA